MGELELKKRIEGAFERYFGPRDGLCAAEAMLCTSAMAIADHYPDCRERMAAIDEIISAAYHLSLAKGAENGFA